MGFAKLASLFIHKRAVGTGSLRVSVQRLAERTRLQDLRSAYHYFDPGRVMATVFPQLTGRESASIPKRMAGRFVDVDRELCERKIDSHIKNPTRIVQLVVSDCSLRTTRGPAVHGDG